MTPHMTDLDLLIAAGLLGVLALAVVLLSAEEIADLWEDWTMRTTTTQRDRGRCHSCGGETVIRPILGDGRIFRWHCQCAACRGNGIIAWATQAPPPEYVSADGDRS